MHSQNGGFGCAMQSKPGIGRQRDGIKCKSYSQEKPKGIKGASKRPKSMGGPVSLIWGGGLKGGGWLRAGGCNV